MFNFDLFFINIEFIPSINSGKYRYKPGNTNTDRPRHGPWNQWTNYLFYHKLVRKCRTFRQKDNFSVEIFFQTVLSFLLRWEHRRGVFISYRCDFRCDFCYFRPRLWSGFSVYNHSQSRGWWNTHGSLLHCNRLRHNNGGQWVHSDLYRTNNRHSAGKRSCRWT